MKMSTNKIKTYKNDMVNVHIITVLYIIHIFIGICIHLHGKHGAVIPGKEGLKLHVIVWKSTRQFSGRTETVDIRGLIIIVNLFIIIYTIILLKSVCLSVFANGRSKFLLDRLGRCL